MRTTSKWITGVVISFVVLGSILLFLKRRNREIHPECPPDPPVPDTIWVKGPITLSDSIAGIPEYHDCQLFLLENGTKYSNELFAFFARIHLEALFLEPVNPNIPNPDSPDTVRGGGPGRGTVTPGPTNPLGGVQPVTPGQIRTPSTTTTTTAGSQQPPAQAPPDALQPVNPRVRLRDSTHWEAVGTIVAYGDSYEPLKIGAGVSCLYLRRLDGGWEAHIRPQDVQNNGSCDKTLPPANVAAPNLTVVETPLPSYATLEHIPPVGRWEWNDTVQYFTFQCGTRWCNVGPEGGFTPLPALNAPAGSLTAEQKRVYEVKGWNDHQYLAVADPEGDLTPSQTLGIVVPHPDGQRRTAQSFLLPEDSFIDVAYVYVSSDYKSETQGFTTAMLPGTSKNVVRARAEERSWFWAWLFGPYRWETWIVPADGSAPRKYKIKYADHSDEVPPGFAIIKTARWRWVTTDEEVWFGCIGGCCTTCSGPSCF